jgi:hypothetical protein
MFIKKSGVKEKQQVQWKSGSLSTELMLFITCSVTE